MMDERGETELGGKETGSKQYSTQETQGEGGWRTRGVSDRVTLSAPLWRALWGEPWSVFC